MTLDAAALRVVVSADTSKAEQGLKSFSGKMSSAASSMGAVGGILSATIAAPLIGIGVSAIKTAASFERSMSVLQYVTDGTGDTMQRMSDQALQLGADTVFSANEAAEGMVELAKAGMSSEKVMDAIPGVMDLAAAGQISVAEAAGLTAAALATFGLEAEKATAVADVLAAAANASSADVADLAFGVKNAGSVFAANGQSIESLATMMALLANNGIDASDAATSLKTMTMRLTAPTDKAAATMRKLGIAVFDADGNMRDYRDIVADMETATLDMSDAQKSAAYNTIFGADAIRAALILSKEGAAGYDEMAIAVSEQGAAAAMAGAQNSGLAGTMEALSGSIESLFTKLALPFLETIAEKMGAVAELVNGIGELPQPVINAGLAFLGLAAGIGLVLAGAAGITAIIGALATPIGLAILAVLALSAAVALLWTAWELNWGNIQGKTEEALAAIQPLIDAFALGMASIGEALTDIGTKFATAFTDAEIPTFDELFADLLAGDFGGLTTKLQAALDSLVLNLKLQFQFDQKMTQAKDLVKTVLAAPPLTIMPFPPMKIDPPVVTLKPLPPQTIQTVAEGPSSMIAALRAQIQGADWAGVGQILGDMIILKWNEEVAKIAPFINLINLGLAFTDAIGQFQTNFVGALLGLSLAIGSTDIVAQIVGLGTDIVNAFNEMWTSLVSRIMATVTKPPEPKASLFMPTLPSVRVEEPDEFSWSNFIPEPLSWATFVTALTWTNFVTALGWQTFVANLAWESYVVELGWGDWVSHLDWGDFVSWLQLPGGNTSTTTPPIPPGNASGTPYWRGGATWVGEEGPELVTLPQGARIHSNEDSMAMAGAGTTINVFVDSINSGLDIEVLAAQLAKRFQQKMRQ